MRQHLFLYFIIPTLVASPSCFCTAAWSQTDQAGIEFFEKHIRPVLVRSCYECHAADSDSVMGSLRVDSRDGLLQGGDNGPALIPGDAEGSLLISAMRQESFEMPPEGKLPNETIERFAEWIRMGAPDPRDTTSAVHPPAQESDSSEPSELSSRRTDSSEQFWSFNPPISVEPPEISDGAWPRSDIDRFILARLEQEGLEPVVDANRTTLARRAYFDLWGLPPDPDEVKRFVNDPSPDAFATLIDRLLDSPRFGERWGRHWLDVARFGESTGHERNFLYPHAWRYRDYVIASFNHDKSYDQFILEQIAGDKLPADNAQQRDEQVTATGFLAVGPRNLLGGNDEFQLDTADDQINVTMRAILGLTVSCARCHDHKFDPISTSEYYSLASIFLSTETLYGTQPGTGGGNNRHPSELIPLGPNSADRHAAVQQHNDAIAKLTKEFGKAKNGLKKLTSLPDKELAKRQDELAKAQTSYDQIEAELNKLKQQAPESPQYAMGVRDAKQMVDTPVRISGDSRNKGAIARRGVLQCCSGDDSTVVPDDTSGRLVLARWLVDPKHPLTARVMVNRIWHYLMGRGLVATVDNFGLNGQAPSHPELLDWLANQYQEDGWSTKSMIRRIMLSRVYQLGANYQEHNYGVDPENVLLWRRTTRRLEAEAIRDAILAISGRLEYAPPAAGSVVATLGDGCLVRQIDADKLKVDASCRSVYLPAARYFEPDVLQVFDGASASLVIGDRATTNVPAQALFLLNNPFVVANAQAAAQRIVNRDDLAEAGKIDWIYQLALGRSATPGEMDRSLKFVRRNIEGDAETLTESMEQVWSGLVQAMFASAEFRYVY